MESPVDHTSAVMVYSLPVMRSGWGKVARCKHGQRVEESQKKIRTAMYLVVPVKVPAREPMSSPETPKSQSLTTPWRERRMFEGLISLWMTFLECKYARPCRTCQIGSPITHR